MIFFGNSSSKMHLLTFTTVFFLFYNNNWLHQIHCYNNHIYIANSHQNNVYIYEIKINVKKHLMWNWRKRFIFKQTFLFPGIWNGNISSFVLQCQTNSFFLSISVRNRHLDFHYKITETWLHCKLKLLSAVWLHVVQLEFNLEPIKFHFLDES